MDRRSTRIILRQHFNDGGEVGTVVLHTRSDMVVVTDEKYRDPVYLSERPRRSVFQTSVEFATQQFPAGTRVLYGLTLNAGGRYDGLTFFKLNP